MTTPTVPRHLHERVGLRARDQGITADTTTRVAVIGWLRDFLHLGGR